MKKTLNKLFLGLAVLAFFGSCEDNAIPELTENVPADAAFVKFFFHAEDAPDSEFYFNGDKITAVNSTTEDVEQGHSYRGVYPSNAYAVTPSGSTNVTVETIDGTVLASTDASFAAGTNNSLYLVGTEGNYQILSSEDNLPAQDYNKIYWRFAHTMADVPFNVDVYAVRSATAETEGEVYPLGTNMSLGDVGEYVEITPGTYNYKVFETGTEYDPETSTPYVSHSVVVGTLGRAYTTQIRGTYTETPGSNNIDFWRDR